MTNVDRLHKSINCRTRRCGKTRLLLHSIIGEIQVGVNNKIFLCVHYLRDIPWLKKELKDCLVGQGVLIVKEEKNRMWFVNEDKQEARLTFILPNTPKEKFVGYRNMAYFELD